MSQTKALILVALPLGLAAVTVGCARTEMIGTNSRAPLRVSEPDLVREHRIELSMTDNSVEDRLGRPAFRTRSSHDGHEVARWQYRTNREGWVPGGNDDTGFFEDPEDNTVDASRPRLDLLFFDGVLVAIADHKKGTFTATREGMRGTGAEIPPEVIEAARREWGYAAGDEGR